MRISRTSKCILSGRSQLVGWIGHPQFLQELGEHLNLCNVTLAPNSFSLPSSLWGCLSLCPWVFTTGSKAWEDWQLDSGSLLPALMCADLYATAISNYYVMKWVNTQLPMTSILIYKVSWWIHHSSNFIMVKPTQLTLYVQLYLGSKM